VWLVVKRGVDGSARLLKHNTPVELILKSMLFYISIDVVTNWPQVTPLDDKSIKIHRDRDLLPYLQAMMLFDNDVWAFDP
jgi:hypothetical protein